MFGFKNCNISHCSYWIFAYVGVCLIFYLLHKSYKDENRKEKNNTEFGESEIKSFEEKISCPVGKNDEKRSLDLSKFKFIFSKSPFK